MTNGPLIRMTALAALPTLALVLALTGGPSNAQSDEPEAAETSDDAMTIDRIETIIKRLDEDSERNGNSFLFSFAERQILLVSDPEADRMRIMIPVNDAAALDPEELMRLMQANFDSALDARYAIANGTLWSTFLHHRVSLCSAAATRASCSGASSSTSCSGADARRSESLEARVQAQLQLAFFDAFAVLVHVAELRLGAIA